MSGWSANCGTATIGTPAVSPPSTVPVPPWHTIAAADASTSCCGTHRSTRTFGGNPSVAPSSPTVASTRTGRSATASATVRNAAPANGTRAATVPNVAYTSG